MATDAQNKPTTLFLCARNSARSQIAEGLLKNFVGDSMEVISGGLEPAAEVHPLAIEVMQEIGIDISQQRPKASQQFLGKKVITTAIFVCNAQEESLCPSIWPFGLECLQWPVPDPATVVGDANTQRAAFRDARDVLAEKIQNWLQQVAN